jgi:bifunctional enzyme CysN/CysC
VTETRSATETTRVVCYGGAGAGTSSLVASLAGRSFIPVEVQAEDHRVRDVLLAAAVVVTDGLRATPADVRADVKLAGLAHVPHVLVAVTKLDLADDAERRFREVERACITGDVAAHDVLCVPVSAQDGGNVVFRTERFPWYDGTTVAESLDTIAVEIGSADDPPDPHPGTRFRATIVWGAEQPMLRGRTYVLRRGSDSATATVSPLRYRVDLDSLERVAATSLRLDEIGSCDLELDEAILLDPSPRRRTARAFALHDQITQSEVGAGFLEFALRRSDNVRWQELDVDKRARATLKEQKPCLVWLTGLSGAGKSTIANLVERALHASGHHTYVLDGDNVRHGLTKDLGFTDADRVENIRRAGEVAKLMVDAGLIVLASFISPFRSERHTVRDLVEEGEFIEVFVDAPLAVAEARDPKGLYAKARRGELVNFTGVDSPYEAPEAPDLHVDTSALTPDEAAEIVLDALRERGITRG